MKPLKPTTLNPFVSMISPDDYSLFLYFPKETSTLKAFHSTHPYPKKYYFNNSRIMRILNGFISRMLLPFLI